MRITRKVRFRMLAATVAAGAIGLTAAGASAYTDGTSFASGQASATLGYGVQTVSGATVDSVVYGFSDDDSTITSVTISTDGNTAASTASVGFTLTGSTTTTATACGTGSFNDSLGTNGETVYDCTVSQAVDTVVGTNILIS